MEHPGIVFVPTLSSTSTGTFMFHQSYSILYVIVDVVLIHCSLQSRKLGTLFAPSPKAPQTSSKMLSIATSPLAHPFHIPFAGCRRLKG
jgi:hypothetical protein